MRPLLLLICLLPTWLLADDYGYPLHNPFEATIAGTPAALRPALPDEQSISQRDYSLNLRPERANRSRSMPASISTPAALGSSRLGS